MTKITVTPIESVCRWEAGEVSHSSGWWEGGAEWLRSRRDMHQPLVCKKKELVTPCLSEETHDCLHLLQANNLCVNGGLKGL